MDTDLIDIEDELRQLKKERDARDTSRDAIVQTRDRAAATQQALGLLNDILDGTRRRAESLEKKVDATEAGLQKVARTAATLRWVVVGLGCFIVLLLATVVDSTRSATQGTSSILTRLDDIEKRGVAISVARYESPSFNPGVSICKQTNRKDGPCDCLFELASDGTMASQTCESIVSIARKNVDAAVVLTVGGHDIQELSPTLEKAYETNQHLANARARVISDALRASLDEMRRGMAERPRPFPITRYIPSTRKAAHDGPTADDRTVSLTIVRAESTP